MGQQAICKCRFGKKLAEGKALLETEELVFRGGELRLKIPFRAMNSIQVEHGWLRVNFPEGVAAFELGAQAAKWAEKIKNPKSLIDKLGVKAGFRVAVQGVNDADFRRDLETRTRDILEGKPAKDSDIIFFGTARAEELKELRGLQKSLKPDGAVWVVYPKGQKQITENDVLVAGKDAGLVDVKVARFSASHTALKFVIPTARRSR
jgi:hypothetical protein